MFSRATLIAMLIGTSSLLATPRSHAIDNDFTLTVTEYIKINALVGTLSGLLVTLWTYRNWSERRNKLSQQIANKRIPGYVYTPDQSTLATDEAIQQETQYFAQPALLTLGTAIAFNMLFSSPLLSMLIASWAYSSHKNIPLDSDRYRV